MADEDSKDGKLLSVEASHYLIPSAEILKIPSFAEILEQLSLLIPATNIILLNSNLCNDRQIIKAAKRIDAVIFDNQHHALTYSQRKSGESVSDYEWRLVLDAAKYYKSVTRGVIPIIVLSEHFSAENVQGINVCGISLYLKQFYPELKELFELYQAIDHEKEQEIKHGSIYEAVMTS